MTDKEYLQAIVREAVEDTLYEFKSDLKRDIAQRDQYDKTMSRYGHTAMGKDGRKAPSYGDLQRAHDANNKADSMKNGRVHNKMGYHAQNLRNSINTAANKNDKLNSFGLNYYDKKYKKAKAAVGESFYAGDLNDREIIDAYCEGYLSDADIAEGFQNDIVSEAVLSYISEID